MRAARLALAIVGFALACGRGAPVATQDRVSAEGYGRVRVGMSVEEAASAFGAPLRPLAPIGDDARSCHYVFPGGHPGAVSFMIVAARVARVDITEGGPSTVDGVGVGSPEADVKRVYRDRVEISPHKYTAPVGHYLTVAEGELAIVFETDGSRVTRYRAGRFPEVAWVEGCS